MTENDVQKELEEITRRGEDLRKAEEDIKEKLGDLQQNIRAGNVSIGDEVTDFMIVHFRDFSAKAGEEYKSLQERIKGFKISVDANKGNLVLVVDGEYRGDLFTQLREERLGVINSPLKVNVKEGTIAIPVPGTAYKDEPRGEWSAIKGDNIGLTTDDLRFLGKEDGSRRITAYFGDDVSGYYRKQDPSQILRYIHALEMIGQPVPKDFAEAQAAKDLQIQQREVMDGLLFLEHEARREGGASDASPEDIKGLYIRAIELGVHEADDLVVGNCQDDDTMTPAAKHIRLYAHLYGITIPGFREEQQEVFTRLMTLSLKHEGEGDSIEHKKKVVGCLERAMQLCMHKGDLKLEGIGGEERDVPNYISNVIQLYKLNIRIPEPDHLAPKPEMG